MSNSGRFLEAFNKIERHLRQVMNTGKETSFGTLVTQSSNSDRLVRHYASDLREFADLRNAIVHESKGGYVIAEPNDEAVRCIESIAAVLTDPPKVIPLFQTQVYKLQITDPIAEAVKLMINENFSQIPIYAVQEFVALLTTNTVARWLGASIKEDVLSLSETSIKNVLEYAEEKDNYCFLSRNETIFAALQRFQEYQEKGRKLEAILITQNGKVSEAPLGIITIWDLQQIYQKL